MDWTGIGLLNIRTPETRETPNFIGILLQPDEDEMLAVWSMDVHVFRFNHPEQARELQASQALTSPTNENVDDEKQIDWDFASEELKTKQGIDLKVEMAKKLKEIEDQWKKDKEELTMQFQKERQKYDDQIESLQKQVMEQSMTMSMYR